MHLNLRGAVAHLDASDEIAEIQLTLPEALGAARAAFEDLAIAVFFHAMRGYLGSRWRPHEVRFSHGPPDDPTPYRRLFGEAVSFDALNGGVAFAAADLERPTIAHDRRRRRLELAARVASSRLGVSFEEQVRWAIHAHLLQGPVTAEEVAHDLGLAHRDPQPPARRPGIDLRRPAEGGPLRHGAASAQPVDHAPGRDRHRRRLQRAQRLFQRLSPMVGRDAQDLARGQRRRLTGPPPPIGLLPLILRA